MLASTFAQTAPGEHQGYSYTRSGNPNRVQLEASVAALEGGKHGLAFASGSAATATLLQTLRPGQRVVATPDQTIPRRKWSDDADALEKIITTHAVCGVIIGYPLNMDGSSGPRAQATRAFARNLTRLTDLPIAYWDERLSTVAAERALLEADTSRKRRSEVIDHVAAGYILQGALDRLGHMRRQS